jgi:tetratricopeptide (TPR) repeat protein
VDINAGQRALIEQLIADKAITLATARREAYEDRAKLSKDLDAKHRALRAAVARESGNAAELARVRKERDEIARQRQLADAGQEELSQKLQVRDRELQAAEARASGNAAELARVRKARDQIATQRQELVAALAERDQTLAAELRAYREVVTGIATSPDPRKRRALQRFADGEQREALADFDAIADANRARRVKAVDSADANRATRAKAIDIADAAERRPTAKLALQARDNGTVTLEEVVRRHEQLTRLDPGMTLDWIHLAQLYDEQGQLDEARKAAQSAYMSLAGGDDRARAVVLCELGDLAVEAGDHKDARTRFEEAVVIARKLANDNPTSTEAQRDLSINLGKLGSVAMQTGNLKAAKARFKEALLISRKLAKANPTSAEARRDLCVDLARLGDVAVEAGDLKDAKAHFEEYLLIARRLAEDNPTSAQAQRDLCVILDRLGDVAARAGDFRYAKARFDESLIIARKLARDNPTSALAQRDLSVNLSNVGGVAVDSGDLQDAKARFEEGLLITRKLARDNPTSAEAQRTLSINLEKLGDVALKAGDLQDAKARFEEELPIARKLARDNPTSAEAHRDLSISLVKLGDVAVQARDLKIAKGRFEQALLIKRKLANDNPTSAEAQRDLSISLGKLGSVAMLAGDLRNATARFEEALLIARNSPTTTPLPPRPSEIYSAHCLRWACSPRTVTSSAKQWRSVASSNEAGASRPAIAISSTRFATPSGGSSNCHALPHRDPPRVRQRLGRRPTSPPQPARREQGDQQGARSPRRGRPAQLATADPQRDGRRRDRGVSRAPGIATGSASFTSGATRAARPCCSKTPPATRPRPTRAAWRATSASNGV